MNITTKRLISLIVCTTISLHGLNVLKAQQKESTPVIVQMSPPVVVNFQQLADYELTHPLKKKKRFIEQGEDREKNGTFTPQPVPHDAVSFNMQTVNKGGGTATTFSAAPVISFNGTLDNGTLIPPDIRGAAGPNHVMETTNQEFKIYSKAGALVSTLSINTFFNGSGGVANSYFDPHIIYDSNNGRYVVCIDGNFSNNHGGIFLAVSQTNNPTGLWWLYSVDATGNTVDFMDYPLLGLNNNWVVVTGRNFKSTGPVTATIFVWNRATVYAGSATSASVFTDATNGIVLAPAQTYDVAQNTEYLVCDWNGNSGGSGYLRLSSITGTAAAPSYSSGSTVGVASPWNSNGNITVGATQSGTATKIESGDGRIGNALFINGSLWFSHTAYLPAVSPTRSAIDWWQVNPVGPVVQQYGRVDSAVTGNFNFYSGIAVNSAGDALIGYCHSSANMFASSAYSFHAATDASGTSQSMYIYKPGLASYNKTFGSGRNRYGDYTMSAVDPVDNSFWNFSEWAQTGNNWGTVIANIASGGSATLTAISTSAITPFAYCAGAAVSVPFTVTGTANAGNVFTAQLSNSSGSFASPTTIGTLSSMTAGTVAATIPAAVTNGTGYRIRVVSSNPFVTGSDNGANISISAQVAAAGSVSGPAIVCAGTTVAYSVPAIGNATSYNWTLPPNATIQTGSSTSSITVAFATNSTSGNVTVAGINGTCTGASSTLVVTVNASPATPAAGNVSGCSGTPITLSGSPSGGTFSVANPYTGPGTTYTYTVTNGFGCSSTSAPATITVNAVPSCNITGNSTICQGSATQLCASSANSYLWSTGAATQCISTSTAGTYTVTTQSSAGCTSSCNVTITANTAPVCSITGAASICQFTSTQWCAPAGLSSYLWSTGASTQCITLSATGTYTVMVTNANGCTSSCSLNLTVNASPSCSITGTGVICSGTSSQFCASAGNAGYSWSTGASTQCVALSATGIYTVTVTNASGCSNSCSASLTVQAAPSCTISGNTSICQGNSTQFCAPPGNAAYSWSTGGSSQCISLTAAGTYTVTVTNANGCTSSCSNTLTVGSSINCEITGSTSVCAGSGAQWCAPVGMASYLWSNGTTTQCTGLTASGTYTVTVTDANGCSGVCSQTLTINPVPVCQISGNSATCQGSSVQFCAATIAGTYLWSSGETTQCVTLSTSGTYIVTVTDVNGCTSSCNKILTVNTAPLCQISGNSSVCTGSSAQFCAPAMLTGTYLWSNGATNQCITATASGVYTVTVTDANGCTSSCSKTLTINTAPVCQISGSSSVCTGSSTQFCAAAIAGTYLWSNGATSQCITLTTAGTYTVTVTDANGCTNSCTKTLTVKALPAKPSVITATGGNTKMCPGDSKVYSINNVNGATSYLWTPPAGANVSAGQGTISATITYTANFIATDSLKVAAINTCGTGPYRALKITRGNKPAQPSIITGAVNGVCNSTGIPYSVANVAGVSYNWTNSNSNAAVSGGQGSSAITADFSAGYVTGTLTVTPGNGCGTGTARSLTVKATPATPGSITGATTVCANQFGVPYSIAPVPFTTNYTWVGPTGSHINDGSVTSGNATLVTTATNVTVNYGANAGVVKVRANNACDNGTYRSITVAFNCREANNASAFDVNLFPNPADDELTVSFNSLSQSSYSIKVNDIIGNTLLMNSGVSEKGENSFKLSLEDISPGVYLVEIKNGDMSRVMKLVVN